MSESKSEPDYPIYPERFPPNFMNIGGKSFGWVYENKKEFVDFTLNDMRGCTGLFLQWKDYCCKLHKLEHGTPRVTLNRNP